MNVYRTLTTPSRGSNGNNDTATDVGLTTHPASACSSRRCLCQSYGAGEGIYDGSPPNITGPVKKSRNDNKDDRIMAPAPPTVGVGESMTTSTSTLRCSVCIKQILQPYVLRHERAVKDHVETKADCQHRLSQISHYLSAAGGEQHHNSSGTSNHHNHNNRLSELQAESQYLRNKLNQLRSHCGDVAVRIAAQAVENDTHREETKRYVDAARQRHTLHGLEHSLLDGSLYQAIDLSTRTVRVLRFSWARKVLSMYRLYIDPEDIKPTVLQQKRQQKQQQQQQQEKKDKETGTSTEEGDYGSLAVESSSRAKPQNHQQHQKVGGIMNYQRTTARGIAKIAGLPLPNAGPELYGVLPPSELVSALRLVASLTQTLARTLGIVLPHPIFLTMNSNNTNTNNSNNFAGGSGCGDITDLISNDQLRRYRNQKFGKYSINDSGDGNDDNTSLSSPFHHLDDDLKDHSASSSNQRRANDHYHSRYLSNPFSYHSTSPSSSNRVGSAGSDAMGSSNGAPYGTSSTSSLMSFMDGAYWTTKAKKVLAKATGHHHAITNAQAHQSLSTSTSMGGGSNANSMKTFIPPSTDATIVAQRIQHVTGVIIADSDESQDHHGKTGCTSSPTSTSVGVGPGGVGGTQASRFTLSIETINQDEFAIALQLLQNNVMILCIRSGVPVSKLWPAEAMLLNLHELALFCHQQTAVSF